MISELLERSLLEQPERRPDGLLWVSDLGYHPTKAMNRVLYGKREQFDLPVLKAMQDGNMYEADTIARLTRFYPGTVHTQFPLWNERWTGYVDLVLDHGTEHPTIVEHKATDATYWCKTKPDDLGAAYAPIKATHVCQLWLYGQLYQAKYNVLPKLVLYYRAWKHECEVEIVAVERDFVEVEGSLDGKAIGRTLPIAPAVLRDELEYWYERRMLPFACPAAGIGVNTYYYAELRGAAEQ
jgi:hypothetical protein